MNQADWAYPSVKVATAMPSLDVHMQQSFSQVGLEPPPCLHEKERTTSPTFCERQSPQSEALHLNKEKNTLITPLDWKDEHEATLLLSKRGSTNTPYTFMGEQPFKLLIG